MQIRQATAASVVTEPGVYAGIPSEAYHGSAMTPTPSLSSSGARALLEECPAIFWHGSYLNPHKEEREAASHFDVGSAAHTLFLEPDLFDNTVARIEADDWRSKAARDARDAARADGKIPLISKQHDELTAMRAALHRHPLARHAFRGGHAELSLYWQDQTGVWLKARPDYIGPRCAYLVDYKTSTTANPRDFERKAASLGYAQQAAWYIDGFKAVTGHTIRDFWFVVQSKQAPHLVSVCKFDEVSIEAGRALNRRAIDLFARCLETGDWPGYRTEDCPDKDTAFVMSLPTWMVKNALGMS